MVHGRSALRGSGVAWEAYSKGQRCCMGGLLTGATVLLGRPIQRGIRVIEGPTVFIASSSP